MAYDLKDEDDQLDRGKVIRHLDDILSDIPRTAGIVRQRIIDLMDEMVDVAFMSGMEF
jgi:hypothetical protein